MQKCDCSLYEFVVSTDACVVWCAIVYKKLMKEVLSDCTVIISMRLNTVATGPTSIHKHTHTYTLTQTQLNTHAAVILRVQCGVHKAIFVYTLFLLASLLSTQTAFFPLCSAVHSLVISSQPKHVTLWCIHSSMPALSETFYSLHDHLFTLIRCALFVFVFIFLFYFFFFFGVVCCARIQ